MFYLARHCGSVFGIYIYSGGGGNFVLSTSTLGYSIVCGFVAPMLPDGYAVFYSITDNV